MTAKSVAPVLKSWLEQCDSSANNETASWPWGQTPDRMPRGQTKQARHSFSKHLPALDLNEICAECKTKFGMRLPETILFTHIYPSVKVAFHYKGLFCSTPGVTFLSWVDSVEEQNTPLCT